MASLLELVETLVRDPAAKAAYRADPDEFLDRHGFGGLEPVDLEEALHHAADSFPPTVAAQVDPAAGFDSLVHVDLQELGFDDELRPLDPLDDDPIDAADLNGPRLGDDVDFDAPPGAGGDGEGTDGGGVPIRPSTAPIPMPTSIPMATAGPTRQRPDLTVTSPSGSTAAPPPKRRTGTPT